MNISLQRWLYILLLACLVAFAFQGSRGIYESTEGRYSLCAWEMVKSHNYMVPTLDGHFHKTKPPLAYWAMAGGIEICGRTPWGPRLPIALAMVLATLVVGRLGTLFWDGKTGMVAALVYATSAFPVLAANTVNIDTFLCLLELLTILFFWMAQQRGDTARGRLCVLGMWGMIGLGFFAKGPPALLPLLPILVYRRFLPPEQRRPNLFPPLGILLALVLGTWWYLYIVLHFANHASELSFANTPFSRWPEVLAGRYPMIEYYLKDEVVNRVATDEFRRNPEWWKPFTVYAPQLLVGAGLWTWYFWCPLREGGWRRRTAWTNLCRQAGPKLFLVLWFVLPLIVFCLSKSRLPNYVLPLFPAVALAAARLAVRRDWPEPLGSPAPRLIKFALVSALILIAAKGVSGVTPRLREAFLERPGHPVGKTVLKCIGAMTRDMTTLYRLCAPHDQPDTTTFVMFKNDENLGFDFHSRSRVVRTLETPGKTPRAVLLSEFAGEMAKAPPQQRFIFIAKIRRTEEFRDFLDRYGLDSTELPGNPDWLIADVKPRRPVPAPAPLGTPPAAP